MGTRPKGSWKLSLPSFNLLHRNPRELDVMSAYAEWAPTYPARAHNALMRAEERVMLELLPDPRGKFVLDLACGTGRYARLLNERGAQCVIAADLSFDMLDRADRRAAQFVQANLTHIPLTNCTFDLATCGLAVGHIENLQHVLAEVSRLLRVGGTLVYSDFHPLGYLAGWRREFNGSSGERFSVRHYPHLYSDHVAACQAAGLRICDVREPIIGRDVSEEFPGSKKVYTRWSGWPAVLVIRAVKI